MNDESKNKGNVDVDPTDVPVIASIANLLAGVEFPIDKKGLVKYVESNKEKSDESEQILNVVQELPESQYQTMSDITKAIEEYL
ncbi:MAG: DUF2795 domain-containing protein [Nitrosopumilus sp.]|nr:DUF2795 domain-containing protein [Nitrosopumilus sp.]